MTLQVKLLEQSFEKIKPRGDAFVNSFYENLLTTYPETQALFTNINIPEEKKNLFNSLVLLVENLRKPDGLNNSLKALRTNNVKYGAFPEYYPMIGSALLITFEQYLRGDWTPEIEQAWLNAYEAVLEIILDGENYFQEKIALEQTIKLQKDREISTENSNSSKLPFDVELVENSFARIRPQLSEFSMSFYANLFIIYPETKPLFAKTDMEIQRQKLAESLILVVLNLRKPNLLIQALRNLGERHTKYGTLPKHYPLVGNALLTTLEQYLREDWTPELKQAWTDAYNLISEIMLEGANSCSNVIQENLSTSSKSAEKSVLERKNDNFPRKVKKSPNLSNQAPKNEYYWQLLAGILIIGSLSVLLFILL